MRSKQKPKKTEMLPENPNDNLTTDPREINLQTHEANRKFIEILNRKVIFLERELENAKRLQNEKHKILAKKAKTINNVSQRRKNQIMRMGLSKYKKQLDEKDQQIQRLEKVANAMRFAEINYRKKLSLYDAKIEKYSTDLEIAHQKIFKAEADLKGKSSAIAQLKQASEKLSKDMDLEHLKMTMKNLAEDMTHLKQKRELHASSDSSDDDDEDDSSTSGTELLDAE